MTTQPPNFSSWKIKTGELLVEPCRSGHSINPSTGKPLPILRPIEQPGVIEITAALLRSLNGRSR